jgi:RecB family exonuclease
MVAALHTAQEPIALVTPNAATSRSALRSWVRHRGAGPQPPVLGYSTFLSLIATAALPEVPSVLSTRDAAFLLRMAVRSLKARIAERDLTVQMILRWKADGLTPQTLAEHVLQDDEEERPRSRRTMQLTAEIWSVYEELKADRFDRVDLLQAVTQAIRTSDVIPAVRVLNEWDVRTWAVAGLHRMPGAEWELFEALATRGHTIGIRWASSGSDLGSAYRGIRPLDVMNAGWTYDEVQDAALPRLAMTADEDAKTGGAVLRTRHEEVRGVIETVKRMARTGVPLSDICIAVPGLDTYTTMIEDAATRAGIPVQRADKRPLSGLTVVGAIMSMVDVVADQWRRADLERVAMSGWVDRGPLTTGQWHALMQVSRSIRLSGGSGPQEWVRTMEQRAAHLQRVMSSAADIDSEQRDLQRELQQAQEAVIAARALESAIPSIRGEVPAAVIVDVVRTVAATFRISHPALDVLLIALTEYVANMEHLGNAAVPLSEHVRECEAFIRDTPWREPDVRMDGVAVLTPQSMRGRTWSTVIAVGCIEDEVPRVQRGGIYEHVLPDDALSLASESLLDIRRAVAPSGLLVCTHATVDDTRDLMRSSLVHLFYADCERVELADVVGVDPFDPDRTPMLAQEEVLLMSVVPEHSHADRQDVQLPFDPSTRLSAGQIDTYTRCPFRYYAQYGLRLRTEEQDEDKLTPMELGAVVHMVAQRFLEHIAQEQGGRADLTLGDPASQRALLFQIAEQALASISQQHTYAEVERRVLFGDGIVPGALERWLEREREMMRTSSFRPVAFEHSIEQTITHADVTFPVVGRIDRIDEDIHDPARRRIVDYKTGSGVPAAGDVYKARASQMPLYITATGAEHAVYMNIESRLYLPPSNKQKRMMPVFDGSAKQRGAQSLDTVMDIIAATVQQLHSGDMSVRPSGNACTTCPFGELCRIDEWGEAPLFEILT